MIDKPSIRWDSPQPDAPDVNREDSFLHKADPKYVADYKIQVMFAKGRTTQGPNACGIQIWESGRKLHGGGDTLSRWCAEKDLFDPKTGKLTRRGTGGCGGLIPDYMVRPGTGQSKQGGGAAKQLLAQCPHCGAVIPAEFTTDVMLLKMTTDDLADVLAKLWRDPPEKGGVGGEGDIYLKFSPHDIRYQAVVSKLGMQKARELRGLSIYPLANILKDTAAGSALTERFRAFLKA